MCVLFGICSPNNVCVLYRIRQGKPRHVYGQSVTRLSLSLPPPPPPPPPFSLPLSQKYREAVQKGRSKAQQLPAGASGAIWSMGRKCGAFTRMPLRPFAQSAPPQTEGARSPLPLQPEQKLTKKRVPVAGRLQDGCVVVSRGCRYAVG